MAIAHSPFEHPHLLGLSGRLVGEDVVPVPGAGALAPALDGICADIIGHEHLAVGRDEDQFIHAILAVEIGGGGTATAESTAAQTNG